MVNIFLLQILWNFLPMQHCWPRTFVGAFHPNLFVFYIFSSFWFFFFFSGKCVMSLRNSSTCPCSDLKCQNKQKKSRDCAVKEMFIYNLHWLEGYIKSIFSSCHTIIDLTLWKRCIHTIYNGWKGNQWILFNPNTSSCHTIIDVTLLNWCLYGPTASILFCINVWIYKLVSIKTVNATSQ